MTDRLSPAMLAALKNAAAGRALSHGLRGRASHGGLTWTLTALQRRGLIDGNQLTDAGKAVIAEQRTPQ